MRPDENDKIEKPSPGDPRVLRVFSNIGGHTADDESAADLLRHECELVRTAYAILLRRRRRHEQFKADMFGEPAWDMLLEVYVREISGSSSTDEQLQLASATAPSTAGRWLQYLETEGLVALCERRLNGGTAFVELTDLGRQALDGYLGSILDLAPAASEPSR